VGWGGAGGGVGCVGGGGGGGGGVINAFAPSLLLSVFSGGFDLAAAEVVCSGLGSNPSKGVTTCYEVVI
jgi:hypothetical protein